MKHWGGFEPANANEPRLSARDRAYLENALEEVRARPRRANGASVVGLVLSVALLVGLIWVLWPDSPVAPEVLR